MISLYPLSRFLTQTSLIIVARYQNPLLYPVVRLGLSIDQVLSSSWDPSLTLLAVTRMTFYNERCIFKRVRYICLYVCLLLLYLYLFFLSSLLYFDCFYVPWIFFSVWFEADLKNYRVIDIWNRLRWLLKKSKTLRWTNFFLFFNLKIFNSFFVPEQNPYINFINSNMRKSRFWSHLLEENRY